MRSTINRNGRCPRSMGDRGFSLIEVMVAVLVLAMGMLGMAALQATALRNSQSSYESSQAVMQSYSIIDAMRANRGAAVIDLYDLAFPTCEAPEVGTLAQTDLNAWITSLQRDLGASVCVGIDCADSICTVQVEWNDERATDGQVNRSIVTVTGI